MHRSVGGEPQLLEVMVGVLRVVVDVPVPRRQHPPPVLRPDHALVLVLAPHGRHHVLVEEEVRRLVHQRRVPAAELEPLTAALESVEQVQVRLQVVVARQVQRVLEERRNLVVQRQLHAQVHVHGPQPQRVDQPQRRLRERLLVEDVEHPRHLGHGVVHVQDAQRAHAQLLLEPVLELGVPHARAGVGEHAHRRLLAVRRHVRPGLGDVEGAEHRQRAAQAVPRDRHAHLLAPGVVLLHQLPHLGEHLLPCRVPAPAAVGVLARVQLREP
uniref:Uncharacterized protein n=1 Tax=Arundo donax TaxID=35708 RepID=A0A0A9ADT8_ARUDO